MLETYGKFTLLKLSGGPYEQGFQHGKLLADRIPQGALPYFGRFLELTIRNSSTPWLRVPLLKAMDLAVNRRLARHIPEYTRELIRGLSEGAGLSYRDVLRSTVMPDAFLSLIAGWQKTLGKTPLGPLRMTAPICGCTSVIARGEATSDGKLYHARNFDYPAMGYWDRHPLVLMVTPKDGMPYLSLATSGIPAGGVTGLNAAGISLAIHQHWAPDPDLNGIPVGVGGEAVLRHARSLDDAIRILREYPPVSGWTYLLSDGKTKEAIAYEVAPGKEGTVRLGDTGVPDALGYSNVYLSPELAGHEYPLMASYWSNCEARLRRSNELLKKSHGRHTPLTLASILGDHEEPGNGTSRLVGDVIPMPITVASVVMSPEDGVIWAGEGDAPTSHGKFIPFSVHEQGVAQGLDPFETPGFGDPAKARAYAAMLRGYREFFDRCDPRAALLELREATAAAPASAELWHLRGLLALKLLEAREAVEALEKALQGMDHPGRRAEIRLELAMALDLVPGARASAMSHYGALKNDGLNSGGESRVPEHVLKAARRGLWIPFSRARARLISIDFIFGSRV